MRLIDADELPEVNTIERIEGDREVFVNSWIPAAAIWKAPTVEAIPIDKPFLKMKYKGYTVYKTEWLKEHIEMEYRVIKGISEAKVEAIPVEWIEEYCAENWAEYSSQNDAIRRMLEEWEKENGTDRQEQTP